MDLLVAILTSDWFVIIAIIWIMIAIVNREERGKLFEIIEMLIVKPIIFFEDSEPRSVKYYARRLLETLAKALTTGVRESGKKLVSATKSWIQQQQELFSKDETGFRKMMGSVILLIVMFFFLYADLIAIFNTLEVFGVMSTIPEWFTRYEYAVTFGSFFTIVISGLMLFEIFGMPIFTDLANQPRTAKLLTTWLSVILVVSGLAVVISLGLIRYRAVTILAPTMDANINDFNNLVMTILVPANSIVATALIVGEGLKGVPLLFIGLGWVFVSFTVFLLYAFELLNYIFWFIVDMAYRLILVAIFIASFILFTPLDKIFSWKPFG